MTEPSMKPTQLDLSKIAKAGEIGQSAVEKWLAGSTDERIEAWNTRLTKMGIGEASQREELAKKLVQTEDKDWQHAINKSPSQLDLSKIAKVSDVGRGAVTRWLEGTRDKRIAAWSDRLTKMEIGEPSQRAELALELVQSEDADWKPATKKSHLNDNEADPSQGMPKQHSSAQDKKFEAPQRPPTQADLKALASTGEGFQLVNDWLKANKESRVEHFKGIVSQCMQSSDPEVVEGLARKLATEELGERLRRLAPKHHEQEGNEPTAEDLIPGLEKKQRDAWIELAQDSWKEAENCIKKLEDSRSYRMEAKANALLENLGADLEGEEAVIRRAKALVDSEILEEFNRVLLTHLERQRSKSEGSEEYKDLKELTTHKMDLEPSSELILEWSNGMPLQLSCLEEYFWDLRINKINKQIESLKERKEEYEKWNSGNLKKKPFFVRSDKKEEVGADGLISYEINPEVKSMPKKLREEKWRLKPAPSDLSPLKLFRSLFKEAISTPMKLVGPIFAIFTPLMLFGFGNPLRHLGKDVGKGVELDVTYGIPFSIAALLLGSALYLLLSAVNAIKESLRADKSDFAQVILSILLLACVLFLVIPLLVTGIPLPSTGASQFRIPILPSSFEVVSEGLQDEVQLELAKPKSDRLVQEGGLEATLRKLIELKIYMLKQRLRLWTVKMTEGTLSASSSKNVFWDISRGSPSDRFNQQERFVSFDEYNAIMQGSENNFYDAYERFLKKLDSHQACIWEWRDLLKMGLPQGLARSGNRLVLDIERLRVYKQSGIGSRRNGNEDNNARGANLVFLSFAFGLAAIVVALLAVATSIGRQIPIGIGVASFIALLIVSAIFLSDSRLKEVKHKIWYRADAGEASNFSLRTLGSSIAALVSVNLLVDGERLKEGVGEPAERLPELRSPVSEAYAFGGLLLVLVWGISLARHSMQQAHLLSLGSARKEVVEKL